MSQWLRKAVCASTDVVGLVDQARACDVTPEAFGAAADEFEQQAETEVRSASALVQAPRPRKTRGLYHVAPRAVRQAEWAVLGADEQAARERLARACSDLEHAREIAARARAAGEILARSSSRGSSPRPVRARSRAPGRRTTRASRRTAESAGGGSESDPPAPPEPPAALAAGGLILSVSTSDADPGPLVRALARLALANLRARP